MAFRFRRGLGGDQPGCTFLEGGVFKPQCWCLDHPALCSPDQYKAAVLWANPGLIVTPKAPPVPGAPPDLTTPPASGDDAQATIDKLLADQMRAWQAQNAQTMDETQANIDNIDTSVTSLLPAGTNWWMIGAGVAGLLFVGVLLGGHK